MKRTDMQRIVDEQQSEASRTRPPKWVWALAGAGYGLFFRFIADHLPSSMTNGAMSLAFLVATPLAVGAISAYGSPAARESLWRAFFAPVLPMALMLLGCAITLLEGSICIAIMAPLFFILASLGGLLMSLVLRYTVNDKSTLGVFAFMPFLLMPLDNASMADTFHELHKSTIIHATTRTVWAQIISARNIRPDELPTSLVHLIGVPRPVDAENRRTASGETRFSRWEKGVHFTASIVERKEMQSITWRYAFTPDSFPSGTMDEHVVLGGRYLELGDTTFELLALPDGSTRLEVIGRYRLTTPVNAYAAPLSRLLGQDFLGTLLGFYKGRAERAV